MKILENILIFLFPELIISTKNNLMLWRIQVKKSFLATNYVFLSLAAILYFAHYFTVDRWGGLAPSDLWFNYRFGMVFISLVTLCIYLNSRITEMLDNFYRIPSILTSSAFTYFEAQSILWYPKVPYLYCYAFIFIAVMVQRANTGTSALFGIILSVIIWPTLISSNQASAAMLMSASVVTLFFILFIKSSLLTEIKYFLSIQENLNSQKKLIESNLEFVEQIQAFLPKRISKKINDLFFNKKLSIYEAIDEVLRPRTCNVSCLFSDIRNFTKSSNDLEGFVKMSMIPNVKASTQFIEDSNGISRKVGDLVFGYFDNDNEAVNLKNALIAAVKISEYTKSQNESDLANQLKRFLLISCGQAVVGNLSGYDSSIEITAIGSPVNQLSRLDEVTKILSSRNILNGGEIILTSNAYTVLSKFISGFDLEIIDLNRLGIKIRDFENEKFCYIFKTSSLNIFKLETFDFSSINNNQVLESKVS